MAENIIKSAHALVLEIQNPYQFALPSGLKMQQWAEASYQQSTQASVTLRFVDQAEGVELNQSYRAKNSATNILSFAFDPPLLPEGVTLGLPLHLGDLAVCVPVIETEAEQQHKSIEQHCAHLIIHGMLHLQGYDHIEEQQAQKMETLEINTLEKLGYPNPYLNS